MTAESKFQSIKTEILNLIQHSREVAKDTPSSGTGIYLFYVDDFSDNRVLPIYIGQTTNFKRRLRKHIADISEVNAISYPDYHNRFLWGAKHFDGHFKACKIFKYMVEHGCTMDSLHMVILEECSKENLSLREQFYFSRYLPAFFGFNQINTATEKWQYQTTSSNEYREIMHTDAELFRNYIGYGFTHFNYLHAFRGSPDNIYRDFLDNAVNQANYWDISTLSENITYLSHLHSTYTEAFENARLAMAALFSNSIHEIFEQCKFNSKSQESNVLFLLTNNYEAPEVSDVIGRKEYLEHYMNRNRRSRECGRLLQELFASHLDEIIRLNTPVKQAFKAYTDYRHTILSHRDLVLIFPNTPYEYNPLQDPTLLE